MKQLCMALLCMASTTLLQAQTSEGRIVYERKINMYKRLPPEAEQMKAMIPEFQISKMELLFNPTQSLFRRIKEDEGLPSPEGGDRGRFFMRAGGAGGDAETFRDYDKALMTESREMGPKKYIIEDSLKPLKWKLTEDTLTIGGFLCHKALTSIVMQQRASFSRGGEAAGNKPADAAPEVKMQPVEVWYCEALESQAGPENYYGLPGLIVKVDVDNGFMVYNMLSLEPLAKQALKVPDNGKKITREELRKMQQEQMRGMMGGAGGPGGNIIIRSN